MTLYTIPGKKPRGNTPPLAGIAPVPGGIQLVGAGPGDPDLLTVKAVRAIGQADVIVHDGLVDPRILALAPSKAQLISVAKSRANHSLPQEQINALLVQQARAGRQVVRLKGGDPFIFGRGGEELAAARAAGIAVDVIPGVSAALGCAATAGIPLTHRDHASAVTFVAGQRRDLTSQDWRGLSGSGRTLVIYMGVNSAADIADKLQADGLDRATPVAVLQNGTRPDARVWTARLDGLAELIAREAVGSPALIIVGAVASWACTHAQAPSHEDLSGQLGLPAQAIAG